MAKIITNLSNGGIYEAPVDGLQYGRKDGNWTIINTDYAKVVYVNDINPNLATIFDLNNPPTINDNLLELDESNLYIGTDISTWVYNGTTYVTQLITSSNSNFYLTGTTIDAGSSKTANIKRIGRVGGANAIDADDFVTKTQHDTKQDKLQEFVTEAGASRTLLLTDANKHLLFTNTASNISVVVPTNAVTPFPIGTQILISLTNSGYVYVLTLSGVGVTLNASNGLVIGKSSYMYLVKTDTDTWRVRAEPTGVFLGGNGLTFPTNITASNVYSNGWFNLGGATKGLQKADGTIKFYLNEFVNWRSNKPINYDTDLTADPATTSLTLMHKGYIDDADALKANLDSPTFTGTPTLPTGTIGTTQTAGNSTTALATTEFVTTADNLKQNKLKIAKLSDEKASGTAGGSTLAGVYQTRTLNTVSDPDDIVTLTANQIFIKEVGTYHIYITVPVCGSNQSRARFRDITNGTTAILGSGAYAILANAAVNTSFIDGVITTTVPNQVFEVQHYTESARAGNGLGVQSTSGENEVYTQVRITKL